jgi:hypothetical protein
VESIYFIKILENLTAQLLDKINKQKIEKEKYI